MEKAHISTADEVLAGCDLSGRRILVTGGATGIGFEASRAFAAAGAEVIIVSRNIDACDRARKRIERDGKGRCQVYPLNLADLRTVRSLASALADEPLDVLVNNAGVMGGALARTPEGFEFQFAVNYLGHFALTRMLVPSLLRGRQPRVVHLSSAAHTGVPANLDDPNFLTTGYDDFIAYAQSKSACALSAVGFQARHGEAGIESFAVSPGMVFGTDLVNNGMTAEKISHLEDALADITHSPQQGAAPIAYAATAPELRGKGGLYLEDCHPAAPAAPGRPGGIADHARDPERASRLWSLSHALLAQHGFS